MKWFRSLFMSSTPALLRDVATALSGAVVNGTTPAFEEMDRRTGALRADVDTLDKRVGALEKDPLDLGALETQAAETIQKGLAKFAKTETTT